MSDVKPVAWGLFARVDGKFVLQHPVRFSREYCERDVKMYGTDLVWNIQPLIAGGEVTALQAGIEALRKDAERYAWLRSRMPGSAYRVEGIIYSQGGSGVDAGIDAAIAKEKQP